MLRVGCKVDMVAVARSSERRWFTERYRELRRKIPASMRWEYGSAYCWCIKGLNRCESTSSSNNPFSVIAIAAATTAALMANNIVSPSRTCNSLSCSGTTETDEIFVLIRRFFLQYKPGSRDVESKNDTHSNICKTSAPFLSSSVTLPGLVETSDVELMRSQTKQETPSPTTTECWRPPGLPILTKMDVECLHRGESILQQQINKHKHSAMFSSVIDIKADVDVVMETIQKYADYDHMIDTVRKVKIHSLQGPTTCAEFKVSRFKLRFCFLLTKLKGRNCVEFVLDPHSGKVRKNLLSAGRGLWFVEDPEDRPKGYTRVWFMARFNYGAIVPKFLITYSSLRALPKVTHWLKPACEAEQKRRIQSVKNSPVPEMHFL
eukprot:275941_1